MKPCVGTHLLRKTAKKRVDRAGSSCDMWRKPRVHQAKQVVGQKQRHVRTDTAKYSWTFPHSIIQQLHKGVTYGSSPSHMGICRNSSKDHSKGSKWAADSARACLPRADGLMHQKSRRWGSIPILSPSHYYALMLPSQKV